MSELTREQRHWRGVNRAARAVLIGFGFGGAGMLAAYLGLRFLGIIAAIGFVACWCYMVWAFVDVFKAWFLRRR